MFIGLPLTTLMYLWIILGPKDHLFLEPTISKMKRGRNVTFLTEATIETTRMTSKYGDFNVTHVKRTDNKGVILTYHNTGLCLFFVNITSFIDRLRYEP